MKRCCVKLLDNVPGITEHWMRLNCKCLCRLVCFHNFSFNCCNHNTSKRLLDISDSEQNEATIVATLSYGCFFHGYCAAVDCYSEISSWSQRQEFTIG